MSSSKNYSEYYFYYLVFKGVQTKEALYSPEQKFGMRSAMRSLLPAMPVTMRPTSKIHYFARSVK